MNTAITEDRKGLVVSEMAENLIASEIIRLAAEIKEKIARGEKIYNYTIGDFDPAIFPIPEELKNEIIAAYKNNETNYPAANGMAETRETVSRFLLSHGGLHYHKDHILISGGGRPLIYSIYQTLLDPGDSVIFPVPSWNNNHYSHLTLAKQIPIETKPENNFMPTADDIRPHISKAALIALCSPLNPTGTAFSKNSLTAICDLVIEENNRRKNKKPVYIFFDQIYWQLTFGKTTHYHPVTLRPEIRDYVISVDGLSKSFAATGVRVGWAFGPEKIIGKMRAILSHVGAWAPKAEQMAVSRYLCQHENVNTYISSFKVRIQKRLDAFYSGFHALKAEGFSVDAIAPQSAIYLAVSIDLKGKHTPEGKLIETTKDATKYILDEAKIALVPFYAFGAAASSTWYRLSVGTSAMKDIEKFFASLRNALSKLTI